MHLFLLFLYQQQNSLKDTNNLIFFIIFKFLLLFFPNTCSPGQSDDIRNSDKLYSGYRDPTVHSSKFVQHTPKYKQFMLM